ncbi:hypothetical protein DPEC_G00136850 [Dallia pectoralis]|uniref:Uncharacterized protein n=1 Tax=Dallia pectoralis TaxID=75939 RepID=A0ACC2GM16_DALPE|nr:hypothetical protein DPEC_G00136850 [Dallia pectoralis]
MASSRPKQDYAEKERTTNRSKALEDLKANFYCQLCDKQYYKHQEFDNHINSYDHAHTQRLKELKQREFARNVSSKTRKDERKQERALRRLHELAELRREVQCPPGSGPKFKSTTVAVEGSFRESCTGGTPEETHIATAAETGTNQIHTSSNGLVSNNNAQQTLYWPYMGKSKKQAFNRHKIAFSFSFPKKASVKLESSAAVFCENTDEASKERARRQKLRMPLVELNIPLSAAADENALGCGTVFDAQPGDLRPSSGYSSDGSHATSERLVAVATPDLTPAILPDSDLCAVLVYAENRVESGASTASQLPAFTSQTFLVPPATVTDAQHSGKSCRNSPEETETSTSDPNCVHDMERSIQGDEDNNPISSITAEVVSGPDGSRPSFPTSSLTQPSQSPSTATSEAEGVPYEQQVKANELPVQVKTLSCPFIKPSQPFFSVLSKDGNTVLQWPSEMLTHTSTEPCLSYSCNPLHFDFRAQQWTQSKVKVQVSVEDSLSRTELEFSELACVSSEKPIDTIRHNGEDRSAPDHQSSVSYDHQATERKACVLCERHTSDTDTESCSSQALRHSHGRGAGRSNRRLSGHRGKRAGSSEKWKFRDRRHYRSHKKKRRHRRRQDREEERSRETYGCAEKCNAFQRFSECRDGLCGQFKGLTSQRLLKKSKQSAQNQAEASGRASPFTDREKEAGRQMIVDWEEKSSRQETAGNVNGSAGSPSFSDEGAVDAEKVFGRSSGGDPVDSSTEERSAVGHGSAGRNGTTDLHSESPASSAGQNPSMMMTRLSPPSSGTIDHKQGLAPISPAGCSEGVYNSQALKRKRTSSESLVKSDVDGEQDLDLDSPCSECLSPLVRPYGPEVLNDRDGCQSACVFCGVEGQQRKRQRWSGCPAHGTGPPCHIAPVSNTNLPPLGSEQCQLSASSGACGDAATPRLVLDSTASNQPALEGTNPMGNSPLPQIQNTSLTVHNYLSPSQPVPVRESNPAEVICVTYENRNPAICLQNSPTVSPLGLVHHLKTCNVVLDSIIERAEAHPLGVREVSPSPQMFQMYKVGLDMTCQPSPQVQHQHHHQGCPSPQPAQFQTGHPGVSSQEERGVRECLIQGTTNTSCSPCGSYHRQASPYRNHKPVSFQHPSESMEKHQCLVQIQTHRHILHQQHQVFPGKIKQVLPGSSVAMTPSCPPMLHPVHMSPPPLSPMPTGSITIRHTILQHHHHAYHHAAFLSPHPQPTLFPQILPVPVTRLPMGAEMCPPGPPSFVTSSPQLSVVGQPSSHHHPMAVAFHAMPRPAMFPASMLRSRPHATVIPLRPMF